MRGGFVVAAVLLFGCVESYSLGRNMDGGSDAAVDSGVDSGAPGPCFVGGCSGQLCSDTEGLASTCEWRDEYACYRSATCERQGDGTCDWTQTSELMACLDAGGPTTPPECYIGGCSSEICSDVPGVVSTCEVKPEAMCYRLTVCEPQADGSCGWTLTPEVNECLAMVGF